MCIREKKYQQKAIYDNREVSILEEKGDHYFIYKKDSVCGYVLKSQVKLINNGK